MMLASALLSAAAGIAVPIPAAGDWSFDSVRALEVRTSPAGERYVSDELLIGLRHPSDRTSCRTAIEARGARIIGEVAPLRVLRVQLPASEDPAQVAAQYTTLAGVRYAELNGVGEGGCLGEPNDTHFAEQWQLRNTGQGTGTLGADIDALGAWNLVHGQQRVVLAILDTGIDFGHPEFLGRTLPGFDFVGEDGDPTADNSHGILCAGLAAANADNGFQVAGVDSRCLILPVRILGVTGSGTVFDFLQGLMFCADKHADVVSMSLIDFPASQALEDGLIAARAAGCILLACAGNGGIGNADVSLPGASPQTISIGWTRSNDQRALFSGTGARLDFVAPGAGVVTVSISHNDLSTALSGCSAATPIAAGIVALLKGREPGLTQNKLYELLKIGAEDQVGLPNEDTPGRDNFHGWGRLNAWRSLAALSDCPPPAEYGAGKVTSIRTRPVVVARGTSRRSWDDFAIEVESAVPGALAILFYGSARAADPWNGGALLVRPPLSYVRPQALDAFGHTSFAIAIDDAMVNTRRCYQAWFRDPGQGDGTGVGLTNAIEIGFCP